MSKHQHFLKIACICLLSLVFVAPHLQYYFNVFDTTKYDVSVTHDYHMPFNFSEWMKGRYQLNSDRYFKENFGFRNIAVRAFNQVDYTFFNEANAKGVVIGENGYLYEQNYIDSYLGKDFIGKDSIQRQAKKLKEIQQILEQENKSILSVVAPGKGFFFPEYIPERFGKRVGETNYEAYQDYFKRFEINHIDFNSVFINARDTSTFPLYGKNGIHWSYYGLCLATDSILHKMNTLTTHECGTAYWNTINLEKEREYDYDIARGMHLLEQLEGNQMAYPNIEFTDIDSIKKPRVLVVADSYYWGMFNFNVAKAFQNNTFWYYNRQVFPDSYEKAIFVDELDLETQLKNTDIVLIICTEGNLTDFGWGFVEKCHEVLVNQD